MSSVRAYINGESNYSKGEKNATQSLISYIDTHDEVDWDAFIHYIKIPIGDSIARVNLISGGPGHVVVDGFLQGNNHKDDINDMIWLFNNFKDMRLMAEPIAIWERGDSLISQKLSIAKKIRSSVETGQIEGDKLYFLKALYNNQYALTQLEIDFSASLGSVAREITGYLFYANVVIILLILGGICFFVFIVLRNQSAQNMLLSSANEELDRIAYSISHDLKAPINSMMGLVDLAQKEKDPSQLKTYLDMMHGTLSRQERFIKEIITVSKENRQVIKKEIVELDYLIDQVIKVHKHMPAALNISFRTNIGIHRVFTDPHRLEVILNNLVSNAIKYHDQSKPDKVIELSTYSQGDKIRIDVTDNGIGIDVKDKSRIFEMYYMSKDREKGSGLGLFIVKEAISKLNGQIEVKSVKGEGSTFSVILNK